MLHGRVKNCQCCPFRLWSLIRVGEANCTCGLLSSGVEGGSDAVDGGMDTGLEALLDDMMS